MNKLKWWQGEWYERQRINEAAAELAAVDVIADSQGQQLRRLFELDRDQGREIARLQAATGVLMEFLVESKVVEEGALRARLDSAFAALDPQQPTSPAAQGERTGRGGPAAPPQRQVTCPVCGRQVALRNTFVTVSGEVCDQCYYAAQGET